MIQSLPPLNTDCCIYRVPLKIRQVNDKAYTPQIVSIGPLHRGKESLAIEEYKLRCLDKFLKRGSGKSLVIASIKGWEERARNCYEERIELDTDEFVKMILLDGCFIIEAMLTVHGFQWEQPDVVIGFQTLTSIREDMALLENQLPFFVVEGLFDLVLRSQGHEQLGVSSFLELSMAYFCDCLLSKSSYDERFQNGTRSLQSSSSQQVKHFVDLLRICHLPTSLRSRNGVWGFVGIPNATALHESGIKLKQGSHSFSLDLQHNCNGVLEITPVKIQDMTEIILRNIVALEQCHYPNHSYMIDYVFLMDDLIDTDKDVDLFIQNGVIENWLGDNAFVANMFNKLTIGITLWSANYYYHDLSKSLNEHCDVPWNR